MVQPKECIAVWHGRVEFSQALDLQLRICALKKQGFNKDVLLLLEHPSTITLGRNASMNNLLVREEDLKSRGIGLYNIDRGGDITFHGPGQLVGYPMLTLLPGERDVHAYMRNLEESLIFVLRGYGIEGGRDSRFTGVWTAMGKIAALGVHITRWITRHGFALNIKTDLSFYQLIVPCGIVGKSVTSMQAILRRAVEVEEVAEQYIPAFASIFQRSITRMHSDELIHELDRFENDHGEKTISDCIGSRLRNEMR